jgi:mannose-6-phosphate isomerase class I
LGHLQFVDPRYTGQDKSQRKGKADRSMKTWRKTTQPLMPVAPTSPQTGQYDLYPAYPAGPGKIDFDLETLAERLSAYASVTLDGYVGVFWEDLRDRLSKTFARKGVRVRWHDVSEALRSETGIAHLIAPFLGGDDPIFGKRFSGELRDFFDTQKLSTLRPDAGADLNIVYGCGAALADWRGALVYVDLPKNELQFRARAGRVCNLGASAPAPSKPTYKRFYFVDWVVLNKHKADLLPRMDFVIDAQRPDEPVWMAGDDLRASLDMVCRSYFRVRPWFEPGPWGGQWSKQNIPQLPLEVPNYAWSFELIVPENGLVFESDGLRLEVSFDLLMFYAHRAVLGASADRFGYEFPIRFDFLDTVDGGNLSIQCHPRPEYIREHFGENITQDETYYILDCEPRARVFLGFQADIEPETFRSELERSFQTGTPLEIERFVNSVHSRTHDLFLIPNGTIHGSGAGNLVLEISSTPYIFTFKMYDWLRLDLDGQPRPLNIDRAFENLYFERKGERVCKELISKPYVLESGSDWQLVHLPTHPDHFYDIHRFEFATSVEVRTDGSPHVMNLVEGQSITLTVGGLRQRFNYAETFVVPAAAGAYRLTNEGTAPAKVVKAFIKPALTK